MKRPNIKELFKLAVRAREKAYAPYSKFKVGAALVTARGKVYTGCNVENSSYGLSICAERNAITTAVCEGEDKFSRILIVADIEALTPPCGACRQFLYEFNPDMEVVVANLKGKKEIYFLKDLLPKAFDKAILNKATRK